MTGVTRKVLNEMNPPLIQASVTVDWMRYTAHWGTSTLPNSMLKSSASRIASRVFPLGTNWKETKARNGYNVAVESNDIPGVTVSWCSNRADMGCSCDIPGSSLRHTDIASVLELAIRPGCRVSRVDIAADFPSSPSFEGLYHEFERGEANSKAKGYRYVKSDTGQTVYIGSRSSEKYLRIYDKGAQMESNSDWTRVELECKADFANGITKYLATEGLSCIPSVIRDFCDFPDNEWWMHWMASPTPFLGLPQVEKHTNTFKWLMETVAPALVKYSAENWEFFEQWKERLITLGFFGGGVGEVDIFDGRGDFD